MLFSKAITIPAGTLSSAPYGVTVDICKGRVTKGRIIIPVPSAWCVGVQVWWASWQMWPTSRTEWVIGGMVDLPFDINVEVDQPPLHFTVKCYNEDTVNAHKVWVSFEVERPEVTTRARGLVDWLLKG